MKFRFDFKNNSEGFTLIELLIVSGLMVFLTASLLNSFLRNRASLSETARSVVADIRTAQANALASRQHSDGTQRCGYGIHKLDPQQSATEQVPENTSYYIYVGRVPLTSGNCPMDYFFGGPSDTPIYKFGVLDERLEFYEPNGPPDFHDISFTPPDGYIRIMNQHVLTGNSTFTRSQIIIRKKGVSCPSVNCIYVCVYASGRIETNATGCPAP